MKNIGVLISGSGTNLQSLIDHQSRFKGKITCVISNVPAAYGLERAKNAGIPTFVVDHTEYPTREHFEAELLAILEKNSVDLVVLAGFMRILTPSFLDRFHNRVINIHPALLPAFPGLHAQQQAWEYGVKVAGATVHFVDAGIDTGPIILQVAVSIDPINDTPEDVKLRILEQEHVILPKAVRLYCEDRLLVQGKKVDILPSSQ
ncbi:MAG: phosphoribosylglycinamide formyltransferase [Candidatus Odinarchaeota archaeon]